MVTDAFPPVAGFPDGAGPSGGADPVRPSGGADPVDGMAAIVEFLNEGGDGLVALRRIVDLAAEVTGAAGATFVECTGGQGRVVAATDLVSGSLGRPVDGTDQWLATVPAGGPPIVEVGLDRAPGIPASRLRGAGVHRIVAGAAVVNRTAVGALYLFFADLPAGLSAMLRLLAAVSAQAASTSRTAPDRAETRDLFIAVTSHELRTPVTVIKGYADTLAERWDSLSDPARREAVFVIWQRAGELARLVDRLLNAASDVTGPGGGPTLLPFEPVVTLRDAAADLPPDLRRRLRVRLPDRLPNVRGDRASVATVLTELVTNACKYSPDTMDVDLTGGSDAQAVWIRVTDRGVGIRPADTERAFERFWQSETGDQRRYGGVGLGLYLVRRIVERQNGWVGLRPRDGGGTVAEVWLPRADAGGGGIG
jgi:signal transduction histidine kinase